ncbi:MAG: T9SS type A sorting domain-containing protein [Flavobacteriales bacterium]
MRYITSVSLTFLALSLSAQPVLYSNEMLPFGSVMHLWPSGNDNIVIDTTIQGANAVWDFSALDHWTQNNPDLQVTVVDPTTTPYATSFPSSNYAWMEAPNTAYRYFNLSSSSLQRVGSYTSALNVYSNPQVEMIYPLQLGTSNTDTWNNTFSTTGGTYSLRCVGTGTLILPSGTWQDALMVRVWVTEGIYDPYLGFFWYSSVNGALLVQSIGQYMAEWEVWFPDTYYLNSLSLGVEEHPALELLTWQNPVTNELWIETRSQQGGKQPWRVVGLTGQVMSSGTFPSTSGSVDRWSIPVNDLTSGLYVLWIGDADEAVSLRFVKQ